MDRADAATHERDSVGYDRAVWERVDDVLRLLSDTRPQSLSGDDFDALHELMEEIERLIDVQRVGV